MDSNSNLKNKICITNNFYRAALLIGNSLSLQGQLEHELTEKVKKKKKKSYTPSPYL